MGARKGQSDAQWLSSRLVGTLTLHKLLQDEHLLEIPYYQNQQVWDFLGFLSVDFEGYSLHHPDVNLYQTVQLLCFWTLSIVPSL
jgi:hypothetical protein